MKTLGLFFASLFLFVAAAAQEPTDFRTEQIFLAPRSLSCQPGDSLFVDGVVTCMAADRLEPYSRYLYLELIGGNDSVYVRQKLSCADGGRFATAVLTEPDMPRGVYYLRAYTRFMRNFAPSAFALQPVAVGVPVPAADYAVDDDVNCQFSIAGGALLPDRPQRLTAVLTNYAGFPLASRLLTLTDNRGDTVASAVTSPSGYVSFDFVPGKGRRYSVRFSDEGVDRSFEAPQVNPKAVRIDAAVSGRKLVFELSDGAQKVKDSRLYVFDRNNGISEVTRPGASGVINLANAPSGPVTLFLTDGDIRTLTQTTVMPGSRQAPSLQTARAVKGGSAVDFTLNGIDTTGCRIVAHIVPDNPMWSAGADEQLIYAADYESALPFPRYGADAASRRADVAAWLSTACFTRFPLREAVENDSTYYEYYPEFNMELSGEVFDDINDRHPLKKGRLVAYNKTTNAVSDTTVTDGRFRIAVDDFAEGDAFFLQTLKGKKNDAFAASVRLDDDTFPAASVDRRLRLVRSRYSDATASIDDTPTMDNRDLPNVTVKARVIEKAEVPHKAYYGVRMKDRETIEERHYLTLLDILRDMPLITVRRETNEDGSEGPWEILSNRGQSVLAGKTTIPLIWDGIKIDQDQYEMYLEWPSINIESVEQVSIGEALMITNHALYGAVVVKTRGWTPDKPVKSKGTIVRPMGLSDLTASTGEKTFAPTRVGDYRLMVDIIGPDGITSLSSPLKVTK